LPADWITIRGARQHNLKNLDLDLPRGKLIVVTGISGSGKSSLAFDTIYAEGQRRYVESLSAYARQFLGQLDKPDVDLIEGLSPAVAIDQKSGSHNPRSTVGTVTEVYDYLRLLFARIGRPHCPHCGKEIRQQTPQQIVDETLTLPEKTRIYLLAPVVRGEQGDPQEVLERVRKEGFVRVRVDGEVFELDALPPLDGRKRHDLDVLVDRLVIQPGIEARLADSVETTLALGEGTLIVHQLDAGDTVYSEHFACADCGIGFEEVSPRLFSFNSPYGACETCGGLGGQHEFDPDLVIPDRSQSVEQGAVVPWRRSVSQYKNRVLHAACRELGFDLTTPVQELSETQLHRLLYGVEGPLRVEYDDYTGERRWFEVKFDGVIPQLQAEYDSYDDAAREDLHRYMAQRPCPDCGGARLRPHALAIRIDGRNIAEASALSVRDALDYFQELQLTGREALIADRVLKEVRARLRFLLNVGLDYLTLDRAAATLAGGEAQRIRLATQIGSGLAGVLYVLDEPSVGLHARDNQRLLEAILGLRDLGNTVLVVEHDETTMRAADHLVDIGPGAGENGGRVVVSGSLDDVLACEESLTGQYLSGAKFIPVPEPRREPDKGHLRLLGARHHNLKNVDVKIPLGVFVCVTGVSGSGKSSLISETLYPRLANRLQGASASWGQHADLRGVHNLDKVIEVSQSPIGRTPRSNPVTYTGMFTPIRELFAATREARARGYKPGRFSFNVKGGRCEACRGEGIIRIEMHFLPDVYVPCESCKGTRYNRETLQVRYKGATVAEVLDMTISAALGFFDAIPQIQRHLAPLQDVGLGYVKLGQSATTLSGGEAQRVKLAAELARRSTGHTFYALDEPTTGLHWEDVRRLLGVLHRLVDQGNTVLVIEHNLEVIKTADWVIDLGPEGGDRGGEVVAEGPPEVIVNNERSYTGAALRPVLALAKG